MGTAASGETELIRLTALDYFTEKILIDKLVKPSVPMKHFNTRYSGITAADMRTAVNRRQCFFGRDAARNQLWEFIDPDTIVMVHGGNNDLSALRWIHPLVIDSFILDSYGPKTEGGRSLKNLCSQILHMSVQAGKGHDSLEDALACRELIHCCAHSIPD
jgi:RNA exonuclease 1